MPTFSFSDYSPIAYLVRTESRAMTSCYDFVWKTEFSELYCANWKQAEEAFRSSFENWNEHVRIAHSDPDYWIRTRDCFIGEWNIDVFHSNAFHPKKYAIDCQIFVCFAPNDKDLQDPEWGEGNVWLVMNHALQYGMEDYYGIKFYPDPDSEPEPEENWFNEEASAQPEPEPEAVIIPIPTWDYVETEPETFVNWGLLNSLAEPEPDQPEVDPEPEPEQDWEPTLITRGYLRVTVETHDKLVEGNKAFNLPYHRADAVWQAGVYVSEIRNRITDLVGLQPESQVFNKSPYWDMPDRDRGNWCEWICTWRADFYQGLERVTFEWGFDHDQPPFESQEKEDCTDPLWLGCITVEQPRGKRSTCQASNHRFVLSEWFKGSVETYALMTDYCGLDSEHIVGKHSLTDISRDGQSERDINLTIGDLVGEGIRLL